MAKHDPTRRDFLKSAATVTAGVGTLSGLTIITRPERVFGANDRVRIGVCGLRGRGKDHIDAFSGLRNVEIAALCDVDEAILQKRRGQVSGNPATYTDVRRLLEDPIHRCHLDRHAESLARADGDLGLPGGQGRLRREALLPQPVGRATARPRRPEVPAHRPAWHAEPFRIGR